jgi:hypothetical protein
VDDDFSYDDASLVEVEVEHHAYFDLYHARRIILAIGYVNNNGERVLFMLQDRNYKVKTGEFLYGMPDGDREWECDQNELWDIGTALTNIESKNPVFLDFFSSMRSLWSVFATYGQIAIPRFLPPGIRGYLMDHLSDETEIVIRVMLEITGAMGNKDQTFRRYVVTSPDPVTTNSLEEAMLVKLRDGGKLIDLKSETLTAPK